MAKNTNGHKNKKFAKLRKLLQKAPLPCNETIYLEGDFRSDIPPVVRCTCNWSYGPSENMMELGIAAKNHEQENPGHNRRNHASS